jgi:hypothetical protein
MAMNEYLTYIDVTQKKLQVHEIRRRDDNETLPCKWSHADEQINFNETHLRRRSIVNEYEDMMNYRERNSCINARRARDRTFELF